MNNLQIKRIRSLQHVTMLPGTPEKKFVQDMAIRLKQFEHGIHNSGVSQKQHVYMARLCWKYRRQMPMESVPRQEPRYMSKEAMEKEMMPDRFKD